MISVTPRSLIALIFWCGVAMGAPTSNAAGLRERLAALGGQGDHLGTPTAELEASGLQLLKMCVSGSDSGAVYFELARLFTQDGLNHPEKAATYCETALRYPLEPVDVAQMYVFWADALEAVARNAPPDQFAQTRPDIATVCLRGLRSILDHHPPEIAQEVPVVQPMDSGDSRDDPEYQRSLAKNREEAAWRDSVLLQNALIGHRAALLSKCVRLYSRKPGAPQELADLARRILKDEDQVRQLLSRVP
jgi:hypothetical protein